MHRHSHEATPLQSGERSAYGALVDAHDLRCPCRRRGRPVARHPNRAPLGETDPECLPVQARPASRENVGDGAEEVWDAVA
jgi:hypothetical protein